jgi:sugar lactone lactonase YvrE
MTRTDAWTVSALTEPGALLGEGSRWDDTRGRLLWVDLWGGLLHETDPDTARTTSLELGAPLSAVVLTTRGTRVVTAGLCVLELGNGPAGTRHLAHLPEDPCLRANDAAVDPAGRLWVGTMAMPHRPGRPPGSLWRLDPGDRPVRMLDDVQLANGLAWNPAGDTLYFVDSLRQRLTAYPYDAGSGELGDGEPLVRVVPEDGMPDGIAVDVDGGIWVALAGGGVVRRYGESGALTDEIGVPAAYPTSCAFGGPDLDMLYVTSGCRPVDPGARAQAVAGGAGAVFEVTVGTRGLPTNRMEV